MCINSFFLTSGYPILLLGCSLLSTDMDGFDCLIDVKVDLDNDAFRFFYVESHSKQMYYFSSDEETERKK